MYTLHAGKGCFIQGMLNVLTTEIIRKVFSHYIGHWMNDNKKTSLVPTNSGSQAAVAEDWRIEAENRLTENEEHICTMWFVNVMCLPLHGTMGKIWLVMPTFWYSDNSGPLQSVERVRLVRLMKSCRVTRPLPLWNDPVQSKCTYLNHACQTLAWLW